MGWASDLVNLGYNKYRGWGDTEALADFKALGGNPDSIGNGVRASIPPFNFDYAAEATKAYGELGAYYDQLLKDSKGDLTLALSRMVEDYDKGLRIQTENTNLGNTQDIQANQNNALSRGLYSKSLFDPTGSMGIADINNPTNAAGQRITARNLDLSRYKENADLIKSRSLIDLPTKEKRYERDLEQQRRTEAASLANERGSQAYTKYQANTLVLA